MGTNYYLKLPACPHCGRRDNSDLHIGKSSAGWNFGLRIYPKIHDQPDYRLQPFGIEEILELKDWRPLFDRFSIFDEYDRQVTAEDMIACIAERSHPHGLLSRLTATRSEMGPFAHQPGELFTGEGTYDLCNYEFS